MSIEPLFTHDYFMKEAFKEAQKAFDADEVPVGAVVVAENRIIARAHNLTETLNDVTAHAEMQAITAAAGALGGKYLIDCTMYVTLEPCPMCAAALGWSHLSHLVYGASDPKKGFTLVNGQLLHPRTSVVTGIMSEECEQLLKTFFRQKRK
jgi:tRNA(adenine34) deaminase